MVDRKCLMIYNWLVLWNHGLLWLSIQLGIVIIPKGSVTVIVVHYQIGMRPSTHKWGIAKIVWVVLVRHIIHQYSLSEYVLGVKNRIIFAKMKNLSTIHWWNPIFWR